jgi:hypothetical protein
VIRAGKDPSAVLDEHFVGHDPTRAAALATSAPTGPTLTTYYERWIVEQEPLVRRAQLRDYQRHLTGYVLPVLGNVPVAALTASQVSGLQAELLTRGRPRVPGRPRRGAGRRRGMCR